MRRFVLALSLVTAAAVACDSILGVSPHGQAGGDAGMDAANSQDAPTAEAADAAATEGGLSGDGASNDGPTDGASTDGASTDGASSDGASSDGASNEGASNDGPSSDGPPAAVPPSCVGSSDNCGPNQDESCCRTLPVTGGTADVFLLCAETPSSDAGAAVPVTVSNFRLDRFEVTVGRFRSFVGAWNGGWRPAPGAGKHTHLNGGMGLADWSAPGSYEGGWNQSWSANVVPSDVNLAASGGGATWTSRPGANENLPIELVNWYEAYAFCAWDGGFLPSAAEFHYAAKGGSELRYYPWSSPPTSQTIDCTYANYTQGNLSLTTGPNNIPTGALNPPPGPACNPGTMTGGIPGGANAVGSESPMGDGKYGQADLGGNVSELVLDTNGGGVTQCTDCAYQPSSGSNPMWLNGGWSDYSFSVGCSSDCASCGIYTGEVTVQGGRDISGGFRCARAP